MRGKTSIGNLGHSANELSGWIWKDNADSKLIIPEKIKRGMPEWNRESSVFHLS